MLYEIRSTSIGKPMPGQVFVWIDLICYAVGTLLAFAIAIMVDKILIRALTQNISLNQE